MERKSYYLHFGNDVFRFESRDAIHITRGIYLVYTGKFDGTYVILNKLIYIGKGDDTPIKNRVADHHEKEYDEWEKQCDFGEDIYYRVADLKSNIATVEAALIYTHKPPCYSVGVDNYIGSYPCPDIDYDVALPPVNGILVDTLELNKRINKLQK